MTYQNIVPIDQLQAILKRKGRKFLTDPKECVELQMALDNLKDCENPNGDLGTQDGRCQALQTLRSLVGRILVEMILQLQSNSHLSSALWSAVRARGCQFLGPAMQEDVLKLVCLTLCKAELISRKTLVMYIVQTLQEDYAHVSKTCVGHVVQLLYRASCFNVIKRDGESSLMQLKEQFRDYEALRAEHDTQIVQIAMEAGLRISPDQWSSLLYGDMRHRPQMQSICDKLASTQSLADLVDELRALVTQRAEKDGGVSPVDSNFFTQFECLIPKNGTSNNDLKDSNEEEKKKDGIVDVDWGALREVLSHSKAIVDSFTNFQSKYNKPVNSTTDRRMSDRTVCGSYSGQMLYKTRMCREVSMGNACPRGDRCTYAHNVSELRKGSIGPMMVPMPSKLPLIPPTNNCRPPSNAPPQPILFAPPLTGFIDVGPFPLGSPPTLMPTLQPTMDSLSPNQLQSMPIVPMTCPIPVSRPLDQYDGGISTLVSMTGPTVPTQLVQARPLNIPVNYALPQSASVIMVGGSPQNSSQMSFCPGNTAELSPLSVAPVISTSPQMMGPASPPTYSQLFPATTFSLQMPAQPMFIQSQFGSPPQLYSFFPPGNNWGSILDLNGSPNGGGFINGGGFFTFSNGLGFGPAGSPISKQQDNNWDSLANEEEHLLMKRDEIISRMRQTSIKSDEQTEDDESRYPHFDDFDHVSFTVANSVLHEIDKDAPPYWDIELPPLHLGSALNIARTPTKMTYSVATDSAKLNTVGSILRTMCPNDSTPTNTIPPATVTADCSVMHVIETIEQPLVATTIHSQYIPPQASYEMVDPSHLTGQLPPVIKPLALISTKDPQDFLASSLDRIVNVKERMSDMERTGDGSAAEKAHLKVELGIMSLALSSLDEQTTKVCLRKELQVVEQKIENLNTVSN